MKRSGWINIYDVTADEYYDTDRATCEIFPSKDEAEKGIESSELSGYKYVTTIQINWEEGS